MASAEQVPQSISTLRRRLLSGAPESPQTRAPSANGSDSIDFDVSEEEPGLLREIQRISRPSASSDLGDVDELLKRYEAEKGVGTAAPPSRRAPVSDIRHPGPNGVPDELPRLRGPGGLPPLTTAGNVEVDRMRAENAELKQMVAEYRHLIESNQVHDWEQKIQEAEQLLSEKDTQIESLQKQVGEWEEKLKTNRFVPSDDDLAQMADELDKERSQLAQDRKQLDQDRKQLKEDEEALMKQMREMEVGLAKDRAELARQRTELQRMQVEVRHEVEVLQRGDATMKDRLAQFQRRQDGGVRSSMSLTQPQPAPGQSPLPNGDRPRESGVFRRLFGQND